MMKKIFYFLLLCIGFAACNGNEGLPEELTYPSTFEVSKIQMDKMRYFLIGDNGTYMEVLKSNSQNNQNVDAIAEDFIDNPDEATGITKIKLVSESKMEWTNTDKEISEVSCTKNDNTFTSDNPSTLRIEYFPASQELNLYMSCYFYYSAKTKKYAPAYFYPTPLNDLDSEIKRLIKGYTLSTNDTLGVNLARAIYK